VIKLHNPQLPSKEDPRKEKEKKEKNILF